MEPPAYLRETNEGVLVEILVHPRGSRNAITGVQGGALKIKVTASPVDGKANTAVEALLAQIVDVPKSAVKVVAGATSRHKRAAIAGRSAAEVAQALRDAAKT